MRDQAERGGGGGECQTGICLHVPRHLDPRAATDEPATPAPLSIRVESTRSPAVRRECMRLLSSVHPCGPVLPLTRVDAEPRGGDRQLHALHHGQGRLHTPAPTECNTVRVSLSCALCDG